jgi:hypothetical protein
VTRWPTEATYADLCLEGDEVTHLPSGNRTADKTLVALLRSHPKTVKVGGSKIIPVNRWLSDSGSEVRVHMSAVGGGPKSWLESGEEARLPVIEPRHT